MENHLNSKDTINYRALFSIRAWFLRLVGVLSATFAFKGFMIPNHFLDGGINGLSILIYELFNVDVYLTFAIMNLPCIAIGYYKIGKNFAISCAITILLVSLGLEFIEVPKVTEDKFLIAIFGGAFMGLSGGFIIRSGGVVDGLEVIADYTTKKIVFTAGEIIMFINVVIFLMAAWKFGIETAMYSIITFYTALKVSDYVVDGFEEYTEMTIVATKPERVKEIIVKDYNKALSVYKGERGYLPGSFDIRHDTDIIVTVLTRLEVWHVKNAILRADPNAFIYQKGIKEVSNGVVKKLRDH